MNIIKNINNFLQDKEYYISLYENSLYIYYYEKLIKLTEEEIIIKITNFNLNIKGNSLYISQMNKEELLINGVVNEIRKFYE